MFTELTPLGPEDTVSRFLSLVEEHGVSAVPVVRGRRCLGVIDMLRLLKTLVPPSAKVLGLVTPCPSARPGEPVESLASKLASCSLAAIPMVGDRGVVGVVTQRDLLAAAHEEGLIRGTAGSAMSPRFLAVAPEDQIEGVRGAMVRDGFRRALVVRGSRLLGVVSVGDLVRYIYGISRRRARRGERVGEAEALLRHEVSRFMTTNPLTVDPGARLPDAVATMAERDISCLPVVRNGELVGVLDALYLIRSLATPGRAPPGVIRVSGADRLDLWTRGAIEEEVNKVLGELVRLVKVLNLDLTVKVSEKVSGRRQYEVVASLKTDRDAYSCSSVGWDPLNTTREALDLLVKGVRKGKGRARTLRRLRARL